MFAGKTAIVVPNVVGMTEEEAVRTLSDAGFLSELEDRAIQAEIEAGHSNSGRIQQLDERRNRGLRSIISSVLGNPRFVVPDLVGLEY